MNINKQSLNAFRGDFNTAIKALEEQYGVTINLGNIRFNDTQFTSKLTVTNTTDSTGEVVDIAKQDFERYCMRFGLAKEDFGQTFFHKGETYVIVGIKPRSRKYPILCKASNNTYKFPIDMVKELLHGGK